MLIVYVLQKVEVERVRARAELNMLNSGATKPKVVTRNRPRNQRNSVARNHATKRKRAEYFRKYRARNRLRVVADNTDGGAA